MKITIENKPIKECKHQVGKVYKSAGEYFLVIKQDESHFAFLNVVNGKVSTGWYESIEELDKDNMYDIEVASNLIIAEL